MLNIWSEKKKVNILIELLLFFMAMNFLHYGQLLLPIIALIIFIDNKNNIYIKNKKIFIILCCFALSFFLFSYKLGFYSVMGFCFPIVYYIGSNIKNKSEESIKRIIFVLSSGMIMHYLLNFIYELSLFGWHRTVTKSTRYDIWLQGPFVSTGTATNCVILISILYFLLFIEKNNIYKKISILLFIPTIFYTIILRRRTQIIMFVIIFIISMIVDSLLCHNEKNKDVLKKVLLFVSGLIIVLLFMYFTNIFGFKDYMDINSVIAFTKKDGLSSGRIDILLSGIKYIPQYMWGGQHISNIIENPFHDLLLNIYDYAGVVPFVFMIAYLVFCFCNIKELLQKDSIDSGFKLLIIEIVIGFIIMFIMEPLMTGSSIFLIVGILIMTCLEMLI